MPSRSNIMFLVSDTQRPDWLGTNPDVPVRTPNIDALADRGVEYTNAICPSPVCNPCRATIASGYEYDRCGVRGNSVDYPLDQPTLYGQLRDRAEYHVMGCGKFDFQTRYPLDIDGRSGIERWGFSEGLCNPAKYNTVLSVLEDPNHEPLDPYTAFLEERGLLETHLGDYKLRFRSDPTAGSYIEKNYWATKTTPLPDDAYYDNWITRNAIELLDGAPDDQPWFLEVDFQNPHPPWDVTDRMQDLYHDPDVDFPQPVHSDLPISPEGHNEVRRSYSALVETVDECVGRILEKLRDRDELDETLIVFISDHGDMLGDYNQWDKQSPLQPSIGVPFVAAGPGVADQAACDDPMTILDLHTTFLEFAGIEPRRDVDSRSMVPVLAGETETHREYVYSALGSTRLVYDGRYKLIEGYDPSLSQEDNREPMRVSPQIAARRQRERDPILYDLEVGEHENVADDNPDVVTELSNALEALRN